MRTETRTDDDAMTIRLRDRFSFGDHAVFRAVLASIADAAPKRCIFDLSDLVSVDSAALGMLMIAHEAATKDGWELAIRSPQPQVRKLLELTCFDKILTISQ